MATILPTPITSAAAPAAGTLTRRTSQRQALRRPNSKPQLLRSESGPAVSSVAMREALASKSQSQQYSLGDSSDDEIPVPMKLSALTKALLNDGGAAAAAAAPPSPPKTRRRGSALNASTSSAPETRRHLRSASVQAQEVPAAAAPSSRAASPARTREEKENSPVQRKRIVRLSTTPKSLGQMQVKRRSTSLSRSTTQPPPPPPPPTQAQTRQPSRPASRDRSSEEKPQPATDINTPAQAVNRVRIVTGSSGHKARPANSSVVSSARRSASSNPDGDAPEEPGTLPRSGSVSRFTSTSAKQRPEDNPALQSSMRVKRVGKTPGSFLSGPARRGKRRQSEEDAENADGEPMISSQEPESQQPGLENDQADPAASSFYGSAIRDFASGSPVSAKDPGRAIHRRHVSSAELGSGSARPSPHGTSEPEEIPYRLPASRPELPSAHDQENEVPSTFKRAKPGVGGILDSKDFEKVPLRPLNADLKVARATSPERKPLAAMSHNTPHRPAPPPPPKMSVLEAATSTAGAAATQAKQRRNILKVNGKCYTRLDCLGRGGSAKVYRVTAENGKMFALKRVSLENADETTVRGYKGEIDLLGKLSGVDRVINLFDYEMNEEKQVLTLLMEMGELDLNTLLRTRQNPEAAKFDPVFVRFYWKEMLECLQSVHQHDIVHSDLKPANFVLVQGRLKLIDFGIANAIQTDQTVNVHRETQIGTPNYMSPESLIDSNAPRGVGGRFPGRPKLMKLGKPSDVWSLGCILYQMVYGLPPFGHIANQMARCQAIINWDHAIEFPARGMGGVAVPPALLRTMKRCLSREIHMRPTCEELLHETDPFLYPMELHEKALPMDEELLGRIIQSVVQRCRERMPTEAESMSVWPAAYWASVRKTVNANRT